MHFDLPSSTHTAYICNCKGLPLTSKKMRAMSGSSVSGRFLGLHGCSAGASSSDTFGRGSYDALLKAVAPGMVIGLDIVQFLAC